MTSDQVDQPGGVDHSPTRYCVWCGNEFLSAARFCTDCGRSVADSIRIPSTPPPEWTDDTRLRTPDVEMPLAAPTPSYAAAPPRESLPVLTRVSDLLAHRRWLVAACAGLATLLVLALVSAFLYRTIRDRPAHAALEAAQATIKPDLRSFESATDLERIDVAGDRVAGHLSSLQARERDLDGLDTALGRASHRVLTAQVALAGALAEMGDTPTGQFAWWGPLHERLDRAEADVSSATKALAAVDEDAAASVAPGGKALMQLEKVLGVEVANAAQRRLTTLLESLGSAANTAAVREAARTSAMETAAVEASLPSVGPGSAEAERLEVYSTVFPVLGRLAVLDADHLDAWAALRGPFLTETARAGAELKSASLGQAAANNIDRLVRNGKTALADWKTRYNTAVEDRAQDSRALKDYRSQMDGQLSTYSALRGELSQWVDKVAAPDSYVTYDEAYDVLGRAASDRYTVRDKMNSLTVPPQVMSAHRALVSVIDDAISAVDAGYEGASDSNYCVTSCYYRDTPGWRRFSAESARITQAYQDAQRAWEARVSAADREIDRRPLPKEPVV